MTPVATRMVGYEIPAERLQRVGAACAVEVIGSVDQLGTAGGRVLCLIAVTEAWQNDALWVAPAFAWIEPGVLDDMGLCESVRRAMAADLYCSLTTLSATEIHIAGHLMTAIAARRTMSVERREDMELALHEAISNALVHGNLGVCSMKGLRMAELDAYSQDIVARLADPELTKRRLEVAVLFDTAGVTVMVVDEGAGYVAADEDAAGASGRGLALIAGIAEECVVEDGGRRITMKFAL